MFKKKRRLTCRTCLNCSSKLHPLLGCDEFDVSLDADEFDPALPKFPDKSEKT